MLKKIAFCLFGVAALLCLASCTSKPIKITYTNPLWDGYLADPHMFKYDGVYYAIGTNEGSNGEQFPILKSTDFVNWQLVRYAMHKKDTPDLNLYWAPEIAEKDGKFYLYYAGNMKMRVAVSDAPDGPYKDAGVELFPELDFSIDGHPYTDPVSGKRYLFYAKDFFDQRPGTALAVVELGDDMMSVKGESHTVIRAFADWQIYERNRDHLGKIWPAWHTIEGASLVYRDGKYYCFYSGGNWQTAGYGVGCAVSDTITGPYSDPWSAEKACSLKSVEGKIIGPGHNSTILGPDGETVFMVYHSWNEERTKRQICMDPIEWTENGPICVDPSRGKKTIQLPLK
ncbi:MAG: glycoside hydrolase family 43 protein [Phycisphaerae bacterium]|jgi:beta-xylosidase